MSEPTTEAGPGSRRFRDLLARERADMAWLVHVVAVMYDEASGGRISKPMTYPSEVVAALGQRVTDAYEEGAAEAEARASQPLTLDVKRLARAFDLNGVNWPKRWGDNDFAWLARQVAAEYERLSRP